MKTLKIIILLLILLCFGTKGNSQDQFIKTEVFGLFTENYVVKFENRYSEISSYQINAGYTNNHMQSTGFIGSSNFYFKGLKFGGEYRYHTTIPKLYGRDKIFLSGTIDHKILTPTDLEFGTIEDNSKMNITYFGIAIGQQTRFKNNIGIEFNMGADYRIKEIQNLPEFEEIIENHHPGIKLSITAGYWF